MYTMLRVLPARQLLLEQIPALGLALLVAELFYKFHSFTLECIAFLATWFVLDGALQIVAAGVERLLSRGGASPDSRGEE